MRLVRLAFLCSAIIASFSIVAVTAVLAESDYDRGVRAYEQKDYTKAAQLFEHVIQVEPSNATASYYAAISHQQAGNLVRAKQLYAWLVRCAPSSPMGGRAALALQHLGATSAAAPVPTATHEANPSSDFVPEDETVPFKTNRHGHLIVAATINGYPQEMMLDTGAEGVFFGKNQLSGVGLDLRNLQHSGVVQAIEGAHATSSMEAVIGLGRIRKKLPILVEDHSDEAILGQPFLSGLRYDIDRGKGSIHFSRMNSSSRDIPLDSIDVPFHYSGHMIVVTARVNDVDVDVFFDTGAEISVFPKSTLDRLGVQPRNDAKRLRLNRAAWATEVTIDRISIGPIQKTKLRAAQTENPEFPMPLLGRDFFGDKHFVIDDQKKLIRFWR